MKRALIISLISLPYLFCIGMFLRDIWFVRNLVNSTHHLVVWDDMIPLRYLCLVAGAIFAVLTVVALFLQHRSFTLLWLGTMTVSSLLMVIPCGPTEGKLLHPWLWLVVGLIAHLCLIWFHDRLMRRSVKKEKVRSGLGAVRPEKTGS